MKKFINKLNAEQRIMLYSSLIAIIIFVVLSPLFFFNLSDIPLGWLYGNIGGLIAFLLLVKQMDIISKRKVSRAVMIYAHMRFLVYLIILSLPVVLSYYQINIFNIYLVFLGVLTHKVVIFTNRSR